MIVDGIEKLAQLIERRRMARICNDASEVAAYDSEIEYRLKFDPRVANFRDEIPNILAAE